MWLGIMSVEGIYLTKPEDITISGTGKIYEVDFVSPCDDCPNDSVKRCNPDWCHDIT